jgi:hypothetical protein
MHNAGGELPRMTKRRSSVCPITLVLRGVLCMQTMAFDTLHKTIRCIGPGLCIMLEVNFRESDLCQVRE